jgi:hypothetical protein
MPGGALMKTMFTQFYQLTLPVVRRLKWAHMKSDAAQLNLVFAWLWILLGFLSGMGLGLFFHRENWLGGYGSFKRRMYRLGHISFFGLGVVNLLFWLTMQKIPVPNLLATGASWAFIVGGVTMPLCCLVMAHRVKAHLVFTVPVVSLIAGALLILATLVHGPRPTPAAAEKLNSQLSALNHP